jgi:hypothetical protein
MVRAIARARRCFMDFEGALKGENSPSRNEVSPIPPWLAT